MGNFAEALNVKAADVPRPPTSPTGHYVWQVAKYVMGQMESPKGKWDTLDFNAKAISAKDDVNQNDLAAAGGLNSTAGRVRFMFDKGEDPESVAKFQKSQWRLTRFLVDHCGLDESLSLRELIDRSKGAQFLGNIKHRQDENDPNIVYAEIDRTAPVNAPEKAVPVQEAAEPARRRRA